MAYILPSNNIVTGYNESKVTHTKRDEYNPNTIATLVKKSADQLKLESTLEIRATLNSTVTCHHISEGTSRTVNITVISEGYKANAVNIQYHVYTCIYYLSLACQPLLRQRERKGLVKRVALPCLGGI